ncbi:hypothetical protein [Paractinoplanes globisporus]|uniref:Tetratricopeptide repeat protein n=1 Tax=Paractinoplanes globisporus TaxID=113565 RepID=A0ABW6WTP5_9ACTN|nr:hypothetical protein [Actinoplanes globisporus]
MQQAEQLRRGDRPRDSLDALNEVAELLRSVAGSADVGFEPDIAATLLGRAKTLHALGNLDEAARAAAGAVDAFQRMAQLNVSYDQDLARALGVQAEILARLHRWPEALESQHRTISIDRRLVRINPHRYGLDLVRALIAFARLCRDGGRRHAEAVGALREAVGLLQSGRYDEAVVRRLLRAAHSIGADLIDVPRAPRPSPPASAGSGMDHAAEAKAVLARDHYLARMRLERLPPADIALVLLAMRPRPRWLDMVFRGFESHIAEEVLEHLVRQAIAEPVVLDLVAKELLLRLDDRPESFTRIFHKSTVSLLSHAVPGTAAAILNSLEWRYEARDVLAELDREQAAAITRLLAYDPADPSTF